MADGLLCTALLSAGLTLGEACLPEPTKGVPLPEPDQGVFAHERPVEPAPKPSVTFDPVIETKVIYVDRPVAAVPEPAEPSAAELRRKQEEADAARRRDAAKAVASEPDTPDETGDGGLGLALRYNAGLRRAQFQALEQRPLIRPTHGKALKPVGFGAFDPTTSAVERSQDRDVYAAYRDSLGLRPEAYNYPGRESGPPIDNRRILTADRPIPAVLETGINSQVPEGRVFLQTYRDVYSYHGWEKALIPVGSRILCDYAGPETIGETRITFKCDRILLAETRREVLIASTLSNAQGHTGLAGELDNRYAERYGSAVITTVLSAGLQYAGTRASVSSDGTQSAEGQALNAATSDIGQKIGEITGAILEQTIDLAPVVTIAQGTKVYLFPEGDWYIYEVNDAD